MQSQHRGPHSDLDPNEALNKVHCFDLVGGAFPSPKQNETTTRSKKWEGGERAENGEEKAGFVKA